MNFRLHQRIHLAERSARGIPTVSGLPAASCARVKVTIKSSAIMPHLIITQMNRRTFLGASAAALVACKPTEKIPRFELEELSIADLSRWTSRQLTELYLARIDALDRKGPQLRAVIEINPDALLLGRHASIASAKKKALADRCTGFRSSSRTISIPRTK